MNHNSPGCAGNRKFKLILWPDANRPMKRVAFWNVLIGVESVPVGIMIAESLAQAVSSVAGTGNDSLARFGLSEDHFTGAVDASRDWMSRLVATWTDGKGETNAIVKGYPSWRVRKDFGEGLPSGSILRCGYARKGGAFTVVPAEAEVILMMYPTPA